MFPRPMPLYSSRNAASGIPLSLAPAIKDAPASFLFGGEALRFAAIFLQNKFVPRSKPDCPPRAFPENLQFAHRTDYCPVLLATHEI